ncbi:MAG: hypothetical protein OSB58_02855, partial [Alphaproteobacteria bacterium]|nr:hypothetical protein [Alphaproteobacteria bacterium]
VQKHRRPRLSSENHNVKELFTRPSQITLWNVPANTPKTALPLGCAPGEKRCIERPAEQVNGLLLKIHNFVGYWNLNPNGARICFSGYVKDLLECLDSYSKII